MSTTGRWTRPRLRLLAAVATGKVRRGWDVIPQANGRVRAMECWTVCGGPATGNEGPRLDAWADEGLITRPTSGPAELTAAGRQVLDTDGRERPAVPHVSQES